MIYEIKNSNGTLAINVSKLLTVQRVDDPGGGAYLEVGGYRLYYPEPEMAKSEFEALKQAMRESQGEGSLPK